MNKLLSIIIPTKNRHLYCIESVKSIISDTTDECEIVIQDNSDDNSLKDMLINLDAPNIVYNYNSKNLSFVDNFEEALNLSSGKYFIILGDDDSVLDNIVNITKWMEREKIDSVCSTNVIDYIWPNESIQKYRDGYLTIPKFTGKIEKVDVGKKLEELLENGFISYQAFNLPRTYHGIVSRRCMDEVKEKGGRYFSGLTPDIYSTIALACITKNHFVINIPFSIAGACPASATVNATVGGHSGKLQDAPHLRNRGIYEWERIIPKYYSVETIWAESAIKALKDMNYIGWEKKFNKYKLYAYGIYFNKNYILNLSLIETIVLYKNLQITAISHIFKILISFLKSGINKVWNLKKTSSVDQNSVFRNIKNLADSKQEIYKSLNFKSMMKVFY